jgi:hypothetical protein
MTPYPNLWGKGSFFVASEGVMLKFLSEKVNS